MDASAVIAEATPLESAKSSSLPCAIGLFFSLRISIVLFSARVLDLDPSTGSAISLFLSVLLLGLVCLSTSFDTTSHERRPWSSLLHLPGVRWVAVFLAFSFGSLLWSETASSLHALAYWSEMAIDVAMVALLLRSGPASDTSYAIMRGFIWGSCCLALVAWIMPAQPDLRLGDEDYFNANQIGNLCAFAIFLAQYLMARTRGVGKIPLSFLVITLFRSLSKTTLVAFLVSESFLVISDRSISRKTKTMLLIAVTVLILAFWGLYEAYFDIYTTTGNQAETLTGRVAIWAYAWEAISDHPWNLWIGHGIDSMWHVIPLFASGQFEARHAENEILQQLYAYGLAGVLLLGLLYGSLCQQVRRLPRSLARTIFLSLLLFIVVRGLAEAEPIDLLLPLWSIVLISALVHDLSTATSSATSSIALQETSA